MCNENTLNQIKIEVSLLNSKLNDALESILHKNDTCIYEIIDMEGKIPAIINKEMNADSFCKYFHYKGYGALSFYDNKNEYIISFSNMSLEGKIAMIEALFTTENKAYISLSKSKLLNLLETKIFSGLNSIYFNQSCYLREYKKIRCITKCFDENGDADFIFIFDDKFELSTSDENFDVSNIVSVIHYLEKVKSFKYDFYCIKDDDSVFDDCQFNENVSFKDCYNVMKKRAMCLISDLSEDKNASINITFMNSEIYITCNKQTYRYLMRMFVN